MTANYKFEGRLNQLGILADWRKQGLIGRIGVETKDNIHIFVHEDYDDDYSEFIFPTMHELQKSDDFRMRALREFYSWDDGEFLHDLVYWAFNQHHKCPLFPVDIYFIAEYESVINFEDDEEEEEETVVDVLKHYEKVNEWCQHCDEEVELEHELKVQKCPNCGKWIVPCAMCPLTDCSAKCPLERMAIILNDE